MEGLFQYSRKYIVDVFDIFARSEIYFSEFSQYRGIQNSHIATWRRFLVILSVKSEIMQILVLEYGIDTQNRRFW